MDLLVDTTIHRILTQGFANNSYWVKTYHVRYQVDGSDQFVDVTDSQGLKVVSLSGIIIEKLSGVFRFFM